MKIIAPWIWFLPVLVFSSGSLIGCASTYSGAGIMEIGDETESQGCAKLGLIHGNSHWGGFTGQKLSLEVAKKRALNNATAKGATRVLWLTAKTGFFGASVSGKAFACSEAAVPFAGNIDKGATIIPVAQSLSPGNEKALSYAAVMRFESSGGDSGVSMVVTDIFTNQIQANGKYRVTERSQMKKVLTEQGFQNSGACNAVQCAVEIGRLLSIDKMFIGSVGKLGGSWFVNIRLIDIKTGEITANLSKQVKGKADNLSSAAIQMANEFSR